MADDPPLKPLHSAETLIESKLSLFAKLPTDKLMESLKPGTAGALKARPDGTIMDGHHRIRILRDRGFDVNKLPREMISRKDEQP